MKGRGWIRGRRIGHHPWRRRWHTIRRHARMKIGRTTDAIFVVLAWYHRRRTRRFILLLFLLLLIVTDTAFGIRYHPHFQCVQFVCALRTPRIVNCLAIVVHEGIGAITGLPGIIGVVIIVAPTRSGGCSHCVRRWRHNRRGKQSPCLARTLIVVPSVLLELMAMMRMRMTTQPRGEV
jgi:hypothetical protein